MPFGISNQTNVTLKNVTDIMNLTTGDPSEFFINVNHNIYGGWFFFIMICILGLILFRKAQEKSDQPLVNAMYVSTALTMLSFIGRAIYVVRNGVQIGLVTDLQMWVFPLLTALLVVIVKYTSDS